MDQVLAIHRSRLRTRLHRWSHLHCGSAVSHWSLKLFSAARQSKFHNSFHTFLLCFLSDRLLADQIKTENDTLWVNPSPLLISYFSPISCTQIKIHKRGRCGGRQCSNGSPIFFFCLPRWTFFYCLLLQGVRDTCKKNLSRIHWFPASF